MHLVWRVYLPLSISSKNLNFDVYESLENKVKWIYTLKHEPFSLILFLSDSAADVDDDDEFDKSFFKMFIVLKKNMLSRKMQPLKKNHKRQQKGNNIKLVIKKSTFNVFTKCYSNNKVNLLHT